MANIKFSHGIDPITIEVIRNQLESIANAMQYTLLRSAVAVIVKEGEDCSCGIFKPNGETITQARACPIHLTTMRPGIGIITKEFSLEEMKPGDTFILNDPYQGGGHLPDILMAAPIFVEGRNLPVAFAGSLSHHEDVGGQEPGSMSANTTELFQEGLIIPPVRWMKEGKLVKTSYDFVRYNVRIPNIVLGDLEAQHSACSVGIRGFQDMVKNAGYDTVETSIDILFDQAEARMRAELSRLRDGVYEFEDWVDNKSSDLPRLPIKCRVEIKGSDIHVDFAGTAPQQSAPVNVNLAGTESGAHTTIKGMTDPNLPLNEGAVKPITVSAPEGSLFNPLRPAPVALRGQIAQRAYDVVQGALIQAVSPVEAVACPSGGNMVTSFSGLDDECEIYGSTDLTTGGIGARADCDGLDHMEHGFTNVQTTPTEVWENRYPFRVRDHELRMDSGGPGKYRGGLGIRRSFELLKGPVRCCHRHDRSLSSSWGIFGGKPGARWRSYINRVDGTVEHLHSKEVIEIQAGDIFVRETGGGGGYGDPLERDPQLVVDDVLDRKISACSAEKDYGVILSDDGFGYDEGSTKQLRARMAQERGPVDWLFDFGEDGKQ